jgi:hypothetical protein
MGAHQKRRWRDNHTIDNATGSHGQIRMQVNEKTPWDSHDFKVKMLDWSATRGSRLAYSCRRCGRVFCRFSIANQETWAVDGQARALETVVSKRWLSEQCPHLTSIHDDEDRKRLREPIQ